MKGLRKEISLFFRDLFMEWRWHQLCLVSLEKQDIFEEWCRPGLSCAREKELEILLRSVQDRQQKLAQKLGISDTAANLQFKLEQGSLPKPPQWLYAR